MIDKETLKKDLAENYHDDTDEVIEEYIKLYTTIASNTSNRKKTDEKLYPYIYEAVKESYLRRGDEGTLSSNEGGLGAGYVDIVEKLKKDTLSVRIGNF